MTKKVKKKGPGRPAGTGMEGGARRQLYLDDATWQGLAEIGAELADGRGEGRSAAVRKLVADWRAGRP